MMEQIATNQDENDKDCRVNDILQAWKNQWHEATAMDFKKGQVLFYSGHLPYGIFILVSGAVKLLYEGSGCKESLRFPETVPFGFDLIAMGTEYPCTAVTESEAKVLFLPKSSLKGKV